MHKKSGLTVSGIVENYLQNLIKLERQKAETDYKLPEELDSLNSFVVQILQYRKKLLPVNNIHPTR